jgi:uncharacterized membrane protein YphA (DoxX/SURF4 family)
MRRSIPLWTAVLLVLLRLCIGWHFFFEGWHKVHTHLVGPTETVVGKSRPFSAEGYFREGTGPLAVFLRDRIGDPDDEALARLEVRPLPAGQDPATYAPRKRVPPGLEADWNEYLERFSQHYKLSEQQTAEARAKVEQAEGAVVAWLTKTEVDDKTKALKKSFQSASWEVKQSIPARIADYKTRLAELRDVVGNKLYLMGRDVEGKRLGQAKADLAQMRTGLLNDLNEEHTQKLEQALVGILTPDQANKAEPLPPREPPAVLTWINRVTAWGLLALGACLMLGLFTRTSCLLAAGFLAMTYLCTPAFPWLPVPPNSEGFYNFINKNIIEMLALVVLATTASGRWFGLDALVHEVAQMVRRRPKASLASAQNVAASL